MGLYDRDYMREPQSDDDAYVRRLTANGIVRPRRRARRPREIEHEALGAADGSLWPEFEGLPVKRTLVVPQSPTRLVRRRWWRREVTQEVRLAVLAVIALVGYFVLPHLTGWRVIVW